MHIITIRVYNMLCRYYVDTIYIYAYIVPRKNSKSAPSTRLVLWSAGLEMPKDADFQRLQRWWEATSERPAFKATLVCPVAQRWRGPCMSHHVTSMFIRSMDQMNFSCGLLLERFFLLNCLFIEVKIVLFPHMVNIAEAWRGFRARRC
jgi:hypothetical protein